MNNTISPIGLPEIPVSIVPTLAEYFHPSAPNSFLNLGSPNNRKAIAGLAGLAGLAAVIAGTKKYMSSPSEDPASSLAAEEEARKARLAAELLSIEQEKARQKRLLLGAAAATTGLGLGAYGYSKYKKKSH